ncbi:MAG: hypothetical protein KBC38_02350 [Candidatus Pacebacteria bacterium]|nr:hypothetical protein [Candidatus Paceibacterota bacterium]MBP9840634.1 hypothetical protein [Candidatus Paceibacterota bacterium]
MLAIEFSTFDTDEAIEYLNKIKRRMKGKKVSPEYREQIEACLAGVKNAEGFITRFRLVDIGMMREVERLATVEDEREARSKPTVH